MIMTKYDKILKDLQAFADDPNTVEVLHNFASLVRFGQEITFELKYNSDNDNMNVLFEGQEMSYKKFLSTHIAKLDLFANKIINYRQKNESFKEEINYFKEPFVEGTATLYTFENSSKGEENKALELLNNESSNPLPLSTKVTFITADAGHGKTYLLKKYEYEQAKKYLKGESSFLFWHVDMQGRQLVRLDEAIMRDLGELRVPGIYMSSIYYLLKNNLLVLSIDGFDELAAETGNTEALGSLANLVNQLEGRGIIIAASRRTFFDYNDYLKKTKMLPKAIGDSNDCVFNELKLNNWIKSDNIEYLEDAFILNEKDDDPEKVYNEIFKLVGEKYQHAFLSIPFLFSRIIKALVRFNITPNNFLGHSDNVKGVKAIIENFIKREVSDKWITKEGIPYLTEYQHFELLTHLAEDMWKQQKDALPIDDILFITKILCEQWGIIDSKTQESIMRMVKMHALLVPAGGDLEMRKFDHPEYKNYFIANSINLTFEKLIKDSSSLNSFKGFLDHSQLPDSVGRYLSNIISKNDKKVLSIINILKRTISEEWTPSMLHVNIGTLFPFIIDGYKPTKKIVFGDTFENRISFSSLVFENKIIENIEFHKANFTNISFKHTTLLNVKFINCVFNDIKINNTNKFNDVTILDSEIHSVSIKENGDEVDKGFAPIRIFQILKKYNIIWNDYKIDNKLITQVEREQSNIKKLTYRLLNSFRRTNLLYNYNIEIKFSSSDAKIIEDTIIPIMEQFGLLKIEETKNVRQYDRKGWRLLSDIDQIIGADNYKSKNNLEKFWNVIDKE